MTKRILSDFMFAIYCDEKQVINNGADGKK